MVGDIMQEAISLSHKKLNEITTSRFNLFITVWPTFTAPCNDELNGDCYIASNVFKKPSQPANLFEPNKENSK